MTTAMMNEKMTYATALTSAIECESLPTEVREKLTALRTQLEKRAKASATGERKPTKTQQENEGFKEAILTMMKVKGEPLTITGIMENLPMLADLSSQRVNALVKQLKDEEKVVREVIKRKAYFSLPAETAEVVGE